MTEPERAPLPAETAAGRVTSIDLGSALDPFSNRELLTGGKINLIALDAIVDRLGARWALRRDQIHEHVDRTIRRRLASGSYHVRVSETDFLICQPELGRFSGQAACLKILREILTHFIGDDIQADDCVLQVTQVSATEIQGSRVRVGEVEKGEQTERAAGGSNAPGRSIDRWTPFIACDGREFSVTCKLAPVFELKSYGQIGFRMVRQVLVLGSGEVLTSATVRRLPHSDILRIDLATVAHGIARLKATESDRRQPGLIVPVSFTSLSSQRGRAEIARLLMDSRGLVERGVICEIRDIEEVPHGVLVQVVAMIRPYCLFVVAHLDSGAPGAATMHRLKRSGLQGLAVECPRLHSDAAVQRWITTTIQAARQVVNSTLLYRLPSPRHAALAAQLGATHASLGR